MAYTPEKGDLVALYFGSTSGSEQQGWRPALVISNTLFNERTGMSIVCPVTRTDRKYPFHLPIGDSNVEGQVMVDQIRSVDHAARRVKKVGEVTPNQLAEVLAILDACLY